MFEQGTDRVLIGDYVVNLTGGVVEHIGLNIAPTKAAFGSPAPPLIDGKDG
jgi:hypothetical protein